VQGVPEGSFSSSSSKLPSSSSAQSPPPGTQVWLVTCFVVTNVLCLCLYLGTLGVFYLCTWMSFVLMTWMSDYGERCVSSVCSFAEVGLVTCVFVFVFVVVINIGRACAGGP